MKTVEKWGASVDDAVKQALKELKLPEEDVEIEILEESSNGFLGIGSKLAKVRVTPKSGIDNKPNSEKASFDDIDKILSELPENRVTEIPEEIRQNYDKYAKEELEDIKTKETAKAKEKDKKRKRNRKSSNRSDDSIILSDIKNLEVVVDHPIKDFLSELSDKMGLKLSFTVRANDELMYIDITGEDTGTIIGKRGTTLDAVQYLSSLVVNKDKDSYIRVVMDAENYRAKRENTLKNLANRLAGKVERTGRSITLEPMNPYERKVIHSELQSNPKVMTRSEGRDPYRRVVIDIKE